MFQKRTETDPLKPTNYVAISYTVLFSLSLSRLIFDIYNNETESLVRNILWTAFMFLLSLITWVIYKIHFKLHMKELKSENLM